MVAFSLRTFAVWLLLAIGFQEMAIVGNADDVDVWLMGGQSNMQGIARLSDVPSEVTRELQNTFFWNGDRFEEWVIGKTKTSARDGEFGPELGFALRMAKPEKPIFIIKYYASGMPLHHGWNGNQWVGGVPAPNRRNFYAGKNSDDPNMGSLYVAMRNKFNSGLSFLKTEGRTPRIRGFLWMQGEQDSKELESASQYAASLRHLRERLVEDVQAVADLPMVFGQVLPHAPPLERFVHRDLIRKQMLAADERSGQPEAIKNVRMVSTDGFGLLPDTVHYDADGQLKLGYGFAEFLRSMTSP